MANGPGGNFPPQEAMSRLKPLDSGGAKDSPSQFSLPGLPRPEEVRQQGQMQNLMGLFLVAQSNPELLPLAVQQIQNQQAMAHRAAQLRFENNLSIAKEQRAGEFEERRFGLAERREEREVKEGERQAAAEERAAALQERLVNARIQAIEASIRQIDREIAQAGSEGDQEKLLSLNEQRTLLEIAKQQIPETEKPKPPKFDEIILAFSSEELTAAAAEPGGFERLRNELFRRRAEAAVGKKFPVNPQLLAIRERLTDPGMAAAFDLAFDTVGTADDPGDSSTFAAAIRVMGREQKEQLISGLIDTWVQSGAVSGREEGERIFAELEAGKRGIEDIPPPGTIPTTKKGEGFRAGARTLGTLVGAEARSKLIARVNRLEKIENQTQAQKNEVRRLRKLLGLRPSPRQ